MATVDWTLRGCAPPVVLWVIGKHPREYLPAALPAGIVAFFFFKHAFVRQAEVRIVSYLAQLAVCLLFAVGFARSRRERAAIAAMQIALIAGAVRLSFAVDPTAGRLWTRDCA